MNMFPWRTRRPTRLHAVRQVTRCHIRSSQIYNPAATFGSGGVDGDDSLVLSVLTDPRSISTHVSYVRSTLLYTISTSARIATSATLTLPASQRSPPPALFLCLLPSPLPHLLSVLLRLVGISESKGNVSELQLLRQRQYREGRIDRANRETERKKRNKKKTSLSSSPRISRTSHIDV